MFVGNILNKPKLIYLHTVKWFHQLVGLVGRVFAKGLGDRGSIQGRVIPKT